MLRKGRGDFVIFVLIVASVLILTLNLVSAISNLDGYWKFDDEISDNLITDSSGNLNDGSCISSSCPIYSGGLINNSYDFDGSNDYINLGGIDVPGDKISITAWINADRYDHLRNHDVRFVSKAVGTREQHHYWMLSAIRSEGTKLRFRLKTFGVTSTLIASEGGLTPGEWIHAVAVYDGSNMILYQNGVEVGRKAKSGAINVNNNVNVWVGDNPGSGAGSRPFDGLIDDVAIFSRALSASEILDIYNAGLTGNGVDQAFQRCDFDTDCNDGNVCTVNSCVNSQCQVVNVADGALCDDGQFCTENDQCTAGICRGVLIDSEDGVSCTLDSCDEVNDVLIHVPDDSLCNDGLFCDGAEVCDAVLDCQAGNFVDCSAFDDQCNLGICNEFLDQCEAQTANEGLSCDDGIFCTMSDVCSIGICGGNSDDSLCGVDEICLAGQGCVIPGPSCTDVDGDGYSTDGGVCGVVDCNDNIAGINPGALEICGNGIDEDCSGGDLACVSTGVLNFSHHIIDPAGGITNPHVKTLGDINGDGSLDALAASSEIGGGGLVWYSYPNWSKYLIFDDRYTTDMQVGDIDGDGDIDVIIPKGVSKGISVWWYENPRLNGGGDPTTTWAEHFIGNAGAHDLEVDDVNGDGKLDVVVRRGSTNLFLQNNPDDWTQVEISTRADEGISIGDIDGDGDKDIAINGYWLENPQPIGNIVADTWTEHLVDANWPIKVGVRIADIDGNGNNDIILVPSETSNGKLSWYKTTDPINGPWIENIIDDTISYVHTFKTADMDLDGTLDVITGEMHQSSGLDEISVYRNLGGNGLNWEQFLVDSTGSHNIRVGDIENDGDVDIFGANWNSNAPNGAPIEWWENTISDGNILSLDNWDRHLIDGSLSVQPLFIYSGDVDGDGNKDIITANWWYENPGDVSEIWNKNIIDGLETFNVMLVYDFDNDGDTDLFGTEGDPNSNQLKWARNDDGIYTIIDNVEDASIGGEDFLQGIAIGRFGPGETGELQIVLSWHAANQGIQMVTVPGDPSNQNWIWEQIHPNSLDEGLSLGDIDNDGDLDVFLGTVWLRNDQGSWVEFVANDVAGDPDRNRLVDIDGDGDLDAVVGFEGTSTDVIWLENPVDPTQIWKMNNIDTGVGGGYSLDAVDMDDDLDVDVILGEHKGEERVIIYENDGLGGTWTPHIVDDGLVGGIDHHDGTRYIDIDNDGDFDIISIGWFNDKVWLFENLAIDGGIISTPECNDGIDNDGDGAIDLGDFSCQNDLLNNDETSPVAQCQDTMDNDLDGYIDFPADLGCVDNQDNDESGEPVLTTIIVQPQNMVIDVTQTNTFNVVGEQITITGYDQFNNVISVDSSITINN